ncbi:L,D-transpeptidase family protein [Candidatus Pelagibacter sp.]|jgi:L,D-peptidoglycan transpeptidase YkuD (ErfK/YbiS/YcfS/YnhG family)|nr:L,D-transpeptidase family protein [Candidatus Pelagibacter sp.]
MIIHLKNKHTLKVDNFFFKCSIGKKGLTKNKIEDDKKTPIGSFKISHLYYRKDRIKKPQTHLHCIPIKKNMGWCDDLNNRKNYNKLIKVDKNIKHEKLYRNDKKYDLLIPIKYNFNNTILGKGSCIFIHLTKNYSPTAGCIALKEKDFLIMLKILKKNTKIKIS